MTMRHTNRITTMTVDHNYVMVNNNNNNDVVCYVISITI